MIQRLQFRQPVIKSRRVRVINRLEAGRVINQRLALRVVRPEPVERIMEEPRRVQRAVFRDVCLKNRAAEVLFFSGNTCVVKRFARFTCDEKATTSGHFWTASSPAGVRGQHNKSSKIGAQYPTASVVCDSAAAVNSSQCFALLAMNWASCSSDMLSAAHTLVVTGSGEDAALLSALFNIFAR